MDQRMKQEQPSARFVELYGVCRARANMPVIYLLETSRGAGFSGKIISHPLSESLIAMITLMAQENTRSPQIELLLINRLSVRIGFYQCYLRARL